MKILIADMQYPKGHLSFNKHIIDIISSDHEVTVINTQDFYKNIDNEVIKIDNFWFPKRFDLAKRIAYSYNLLLLKNKIKNIEYDYIIFLSYENVALSFVYKKFKNVVIFHHNNIDLLKSSYELGRFKKYMNKVQHVVMAEFIKDGLIKKTSVQPNQVTVVNHPLMETSSTIEISGKDEKTEKRLFVGLGLGNDELLVKDIIDVELKTRLLEKNNIQLVLRSKQYNVDEVGIKVFNSFLPYDEYLDMYSKSSGCLLCYPMSFENRFSGSFMNAFQSRKKIIATENPMGTYLKNEYPINSDTIKNAEDLINKLINFDENFSEVEYDKFKDMHSDKNIYLELMKVFKKGN